MNVLDWWKLVHPCCSHDNAYMLYFQISIPYFLFINSSNNNASIDEPTSLEYVFFRCPQRKVRQKERDLFLLLSARQILVYTMSINEDHQYLLWFKCHLSNFLFVCLWIVAYTRM